MGVVAVLRVSGLIFFSIFEVMGFNMLSTHHAGLWPVLLSLWMGLGGGGESLKFAGSQEL